MSDIPKDSPSAGPDFLPPLQKRTRPETVTAQLQDLQHQPRAAVLRRAGGGGVPSDLERETLVALTRAYRRAGDEAAVAALMDALLRRISGAIGGQIKTWPGLTPEDRTDAIRQMVAHVCDSVLDLRPGAELWECNFTTCFRRRLINVWRGLHARQVPLAPSSSENEAGEEWDRLDGAADPGAEAAFRDPEVRETVRHLSGDNPKMAQAIFLRMQDYPDEEIAGRLGVSSRTIRNWMTQARARWTRQAEQDAGNG